MNQACEVLAPAVYRLGDGRKLTITAADIVNACNVGNEMIKSGLRVPGVWEHDLAAFPVYESNPKWYMAKGYHSDVKKFELRNGKLFAILNFQDPADLSQFKKVGQVSPRVCFNRVDERGKKWNGLTIAHVASTPTPVQREQSRIPYDFSSTATEADRNGEFDLSTMAECKMDPKKVIDMLQGIIAMLGGSGTNEPDGDEIPPDDKKTEIEGGANEEVGSATNATSPMVMSQLPAPLKIQVEGCLTGHKKRMIEETKDVLYKSGRIARDEANSHIQRIKAADLSLSNSWELIHSPVVIEHNTLMKLKPNSGWSPKTPVDADMSQVGEVERPTEVSGGASEDVALAKMLERGGYKK